MDASLSMLINYPVTSTAIARLDYDDEAEICYLTFTDGRSYELPSIPQIEVERWAASASPGGYFNANIRGTY